MHRCRPTLIQKTSSGIGTPLREEDVTARKCSSPKMQDAGEMRGKKKGKKELEGKSSNEGKNGDDESRMRIEEA